MQVNESHLSVLKSTTSNTEGWLGTAPKSWFDWVQRNATNQTAIDKFNSSNLPSAQVSRTQLKSMVRTSQIDTLSCCIAILAWGGMNRQHGVRLFSSGTEWLSIAEEIRQGALTRAQAYQKFAELRNTKKLPGLGPAYFTKLIFFLMPDGKMTGYIMDQWTSVSVNLLFKQVIVHTSVQKNFKDDGSFKASEFVMDSNSHIQYEHYCQAVEWLAKNLNISPERTEEMMFSEGRGKGVWRNYVIEQRNKILMA